MFEVVFVCTGNRARSPLAAALFRRYADHPDVTVVSAGTVELGSRPALPLAVNAARDLNVDLRSHRTLNLRRVDLRSADLVLGFERSHAATAVEMGADPPRTFLLPELVALLGSSSDESHVPSRARAAVARAHERRLLSPPMPAPSIPDPLGKPAAVMRSQARELDRLVSRLAHGLFG